MDRCNVDQQRRASDVDEAAAAAEEEEEYTPQLKESSEQGKS